MSDNASTDTQAMHHPTMRTSRRLQVSRAHRLPRKSPIEARTPTIPHAKLTPAGSGNSLRSRSGNSCRSDLGPGAVPQTVAAKAPKRPRRGKG